MEAAPASIRRARPLLGTFVEIAVAGAKISAMETAVEAAFAAVATVHRLMSFHETTSDVSRLNRGAASGMVRVHDWTYQVLETARDLNRRSAGVFNITVASALQNLGLLPRGLPLCPSPFPRKSGEREQKAHGFALMGDAPPLSRRQALSPQAGIGGGRGQFRLAIRTSDAIQLLAKNQVHFAHRGMKIDLGGIAKGFAVDRAVEALRRDEITEGLVNAGGDISTFGARSHAVDIRDPRQPGHPMCQVALHNAALASSAGRFNPVRSRHVLKSDVIDPATAMPVWAIVGATVCAPSCIIADALTKVVMNGGERAASLLKHYGASALFVSAQGDVHITADWKNEVHFAA
jgi:thiamine biosynthesis lipoprotein